MLLLKAVWHEAQSWAASLLFDSALETINKFTLIEGLRLSQKSFLSSSKKKSFFILLPTSFYGVHKF